MLEYREPRTARVSSLEEEARLAVRARRLVGVERLGPPGALEDSAYETEPVHLECTRSAEAVHTRVCMHGPPRVVDAPRVRHESGRHGDPQAGRAEEQARCRHGIVVLRRWRGAV